MAFLQPDILPAMAVAIIRQLASARGGRLSADSLESLVVPFRDGGSGKTLYTNTLRELRAVGVVAEQDGNLALRTGADGATDIPRMLRSAVMEAELDTDLWEKGDDGTLLLRGARDLIRAVAWFLSLDPVKGPYFFEDGNPSVATLQEQELGERVIYNPTRWPPFERWSVFLGFARAVPRLDGGRWRNGLIPDPSAAIASVLPELVQPGVSTALTGLTLQLGDRLPVLDGGLYRTSVLQRAGADDDAPSSPALSLALKELERRGDLKLEVGAGDAEKLLLAQNHGAYHALTWKGVAGA